METVVSEGGAGPRSAIGNGAGGARRQDDNSRRRVRFQLIKMRRPILRARVIDSVQKLCRIYKDYKRLTVAQLKKLYDERRIDCVSFRFKREFIDALERESY